jgi:hypothetical protein
MPILTKGINKKMKNTQKRYYKVLDFVIKGMSRDNKRNISKPVE